MKQQRLPARRSNVESEPTSPLGIALRNARLEKQLPQRVLAQALSEKCGGEATNVRVSGFELGKKLPTDAELTVVAHVLGLSVQTLRAKREASHEHKKALGKIMYERQVQKGQKTPLTRTLGRPPAQPKAAKAAKPAAVPALADLVEQIDEIAPMPADKESRRRWFQCVSVLSRIGAAS